MKSVFALAREKMEKTVSSLKYEYNSIRAGRANAAVLDKIQVDYYGCPTPINQMAAISVPEARILAIQPWDVSTVSLIEKAILASDIGITPSNDGRVIRLIFPQPTEERRKELAKQVQKEGENEVAVVYRGRRTSFFVSGKRVTSLSAYYVGEAVSVGNSVSKRDIYQALL